MHSLRFPPDELSISKITYGLHFEDEKMCSYLVHLLSLMYVKRKKIAMTSHYNFQILPLGQIQ